MAYHGMIYIREGSDFSQGPVYHDGEIIHINMGLDFSSVNYQNIVLDGAGRVSTGSAAGSACTIDATNSQYGEGFELRYTISDWADTYTITAAKGMYLRMESTEANASGSVYGAEVLGVANDVNTQYLWGGLFYAYIKGTSAKALTGVYALQPEISFDAGSGTNTITDACVVRAKVTGGVMSDYTVLDGYRLTLGDMDGGSRTYGNGLIFEDDSDMSGTCALTVGINVNIAATTGIALAGAMTDGIVISGACGDNGIEITGACTDSAIQVVTGGFATGLLLDADGTTGVNITSNFTGTTGVLIGGTATDGISITGICADGIHISGANTASGLHISGDQVDAILIDADAAADNGIKIAVDDGITVTTGINIDRTGTTGICTTAISIDTDGTTGIEIAAGFTGTTMLTLAGTAADGILISGACSDNGIEITGACTDSAIQVVTGGFATGLKLDADGTTGIDITSSFTGTTGIVFAGTATTGFSISGACTTGISLSGAMTSGISWTGASKNPINMDSIGDYDTTATGGLGNIIKMDLTGSATHTATTAGLIVKNYIDGETINGNYECNGMIVYLKHKATLAGGAKSALASFHVHGSSTGTVDYGLRIFGTPTTSISVETGSDYMFQIPALGTDPVSSDSGTYSTADGYIKINAGGSDYRIPIYAGTD